jgi:oxaloacetate decarboxylase alpha subunit
MVKDKKLGSASGNGTLKLVDETLRDGTQSLWGMMMSYHMMEPVIREIDEAGYYSVNLPVHVAQPLISVRFFKEDPRFLFKMFRDKLKNSKTNIITVSMGMALDITGPVENKTLVKMVTRQLKEWLPNINQYELMCGVADEIKNTFPILYPMMRSMGMEPIPYLAIGHSPRHTDEFYASRVKHIVETYKPISVCLKDVDGLLVSERVRTLLTACQNAAGDTPLELHMHGMNGQNTYNAVVAMKMGIRKFTTCCPPLAYGSSHPSVFNIISNAEELGIKHTMNVEKLKVIEERLTKIGKAYGHPVDNHPLPFDLFGYKHQVPGGVISNLTTQLAQLGIPEKLREVLEEIPRILEDMGYPVMITPFSQYIAAQAVLNVQVGRWEQCLDTMVEFAAGIFGVEEPGVPYMNQNIKDKLLSLPPAKKIKERAAHIIEYINSEPSEAECKKRFGLSPNDSDEELVLRVLLHGAEEMKHLTPGGPDAYKKYL